MAALDAAEGEGGDVRGRQSAAMVVVASRGRAVAADDRPAGRGHAGPAGRARAAADAPARLRPGRRRRRAAGRGPHRRGGGAVPAGRRARAPLGRAAVLVRAGPRAGRGPRGRRRRGPAGGRGEPELAGPPRPAVTGVRARRRGRASADHLKVERVSGAAGATFDDTLTWVFGVAATDRERLARRCPTGEAVNEQLLDVLVERHRVDRAGLRRRPSRRGRRPSGRPAAVGHAGEQRSDVGGGAKSAASLPSTLSAFRPVATPVALVVNGAPVGVADLDPAGLLADGRELEGAAALQVRRADARLVAGFERQP